MRVAGETQGAAGQALAAASALSDRAEALTGEVASFVEASRGVNAK